MEQSSEQTSFIISIALLPTCQRFTLRKFKKWVGMVEVTLVLKIEIVPVFKVESKVRIILRHMQV